VAISVSCSCGRALKLRDDVAGKKIKCPACQAVIEVPGAASEPDLLPEEPAAPAERVCTSCRAENPAEQETCLSCGAPLRAPAPLPGAVPRRGRDGLFTSEKAYEKAPPFILIVLGMVYRPWYILEHYRLWAERPATLIQSVILYVGSLAAISLVAASGYLGPIAEGAAKEAEDSEKDDLRIVARGPVGLKVGLDARHAPYSPRVGVPVRVRVGLNKDGTQEGVAGKLSGTYLRGALFEWESEEEPKEKPEKKDPRAQAIAFQREGTTAWHEATFTPTEPGTYRFSLLMDPPAEGQPYKFDVTVYPTLREFESGAPKVVTAATRVFFAVLVSLISIAINAFAINIASKVFGEGADFLFLAVVLAFIDSIMNLSQLGLLAIGPAIGAGYVVFLQYAFGLWQLVLTMLAIMKIYEFDPGTALMTALVAGVVKMWLAAAIVGSLLGL
jgi:hypothetical protein